jgi:hypothetical protein
MGDEKSVVDKVKDIAEDLKLKVSNVYVKVKESDAVDKVGDVATSAKVKVVDVAGDVKVKVSGLFDKGGATAGAPTDAAPDATAGATTDTAPDAAATTTSAGEESEQAADAP